MSKTTKTIAREIVVFSFLLTALFALSSWLLISLTKGLTENDQLVFYVYWSWMEELFRVGILLLFLARIARKLDELRYWTLVISALIFWLVSYHLDFLYGTVYFYSTNPGYVPENANSLESLLKLFTGRYETPPVYDLINAFFGFFINLRYFRFPTDLLYTLMGLIFTTIPLSLWLSACVWSYRNKKNRMNSKQSSQ